MAPRVCPWWHAYTFDNIIRRLFHDPAKIFGPYVRPGMTVMDFGCGMGFNAIGLARIVGDKGSVIAVDLQQQMLDVLQRRAERAGVADRIRTHRSEPESIGVHAAVDFVSAFWVVHEVPDIRRLLRQIHSCLRADGKLLVAEPRFHVTAKAFEETIETAADIGLKLYEHRRIRLSRAAVFVKQ